MAGQHTAGETPVQLVIVDGVRYWEIDGVRIRAIAGGAEDDPPPAAADGAQTPPASKPDDEPFDKERALATIRKLRENERATKAQLKEMDELRTKLQEFENAGKSEVERKDAEIAQVREKATAAEQRAAELEQRYQGALIRAAIEREAHKQGAVDAEAVYALVDRSALQIEDDGTVKGADKAVETLLKAKTYLVGTGGSGSGSSGTRDIPPTQRSNVGGSARADDLIAQKAQRLAASGRYAPL